MASPYTLLMTEDQEIAYDAGLIDGRDAERKRIIRVLEEWLWDNSERLGTTYIEIWIPKFMEDVKEVTKRGNR